VLSKLYNNGFGSKKMKKPWVFDPHSGGIKISPNRKVEVEKRIHSYVDQNLKDKCDRIEVRFRGALCYVVAYRNEIDGREFRFPLCRLRHFELERWSISLFTWSHEKYEPCIFPSGEWFGTIDECLELGATFL
jgi:hypothetical protein